MDSSISLFSNPEEIAPRPVAAATPTPTNDPFLAPPERPEEDIADVEVQEPPALRR
jgi:hypothetical protein